jgi:hypothetical protein
MMMVVIIIYDFVLMTDGVMQMRMHLPFRDSGNDQGKAQKQSRTAFANAMSEYAKVPGKFHRRCDSGTCSVSQANHEASFSRPIRSYIFVCSLALAARLRHFDKPIPNDPKYAKHQAGRLESSGMRFLRFHRWFVELYARPLNARAMRAIPSHPG